DPNGGTGDPADQTCTYGTTATLSLTVPTREGYTFTYWTANADGSGSTYGAGSSISCADLTLYAQWSLDPVFTITFNANGGTGAPSPLTCTSGNVTMPTTVPTRPGYTFLGWNTAAIGSDPLAAAVTGVTLEGPTANQTGNNLFDIEDHGWLSLDESLAAGQRLVIDGAFLSDLVDAMPDNSAVAIGLKDTNWANTVPDNNMYSRNFDGVFVGGAFVMVVKYPPQYNGNVRLVIGHTNDGETQNGFGENWIGLGSGGSITGSLGNAFLEITSNGNEVRVASGYANSNGNDASSRSYEDWDTSGSYYPPRKFSTGNQNFGITSADIMVIGGSAYSGSPVIDYGGLDTTEVDWTGLTMNVSVYSPGTSASCSD
ncbi:MAG: hypothetical protein EBU28_12720, partial [Gammaproteobacteria bacterium]|nr:hypothetical protein [Gammaproteobacteria bacterium]